MDPSALHIEGIIFDPKQGSLALINGEFHKVGDTIGKATLVNIFKDHIVLTGEEEELTLWLQETEEEGDLSDANSPGKPKTNLEK